MTKLYIMVGLPGCGKSYLTEKIKNEWHNTNSVYVYSSDAHLDYGAISRGEASFKNLIKPAINAAQDGLQKALTDNVDVVIFDQTNLSYKKRDWIKTIFDWSSIEYVCIMPPNQIEEKEEWEKRLAARIEKQVPKETINQMIKRFEIPGVDTDEEPVRLYDVLGNEYNSWAGGVKQK